MRAAKAVLALAAGALLTTLALVLALTLWASADSSLARTLDLAARWLPVGQTLEVTDVGGTLRTGGRIGRLVWRQGELRVEARDIELAWTLRGLLDGQLRLSRLAIGHLVIDDQRAPQPATPPAELLLPLQVETPFEVGEVEVRGTTPLRLSRLSGKYVFDSKLHRIDAGKVHISSGNYQFDGSLEARSPQALSLDVQGDVLTTTPGSQQTVTVRASAAARGQLGGVDAVVAVSARLAPLALASPPGARGMPSQPMQASVSASIQPWHAQPVASAEGTWQGLDLAALWPQAPRTLLSGRATVTPQATGWLAEAQFVNALAGPWDRQQLPVESLQARATHAGGQWLIESLTARGAGGRIQAQGQVVLPAAATTAPGKGSANTALSWDGRARFQGINPAAADSRLATGSMDGQLTARLAGQALVFDAQLQNASLGAVTPTRARPGDHLRLDVKSLRARGRWASPVLELQSLALSTADEQVQGSATLNLTSLAVQGQLSLRVPGAQADVSGHMSSAAGLGELRIQLLDAHLASRWLARWPVMPAALAQTAMQGTGAFTAHWRGGWQNQARELQVQADLELPRLELRAADATPAQAWRLGSVKAGLAGSLAALRFSASGGAETDSRRFTLLAQAQGGRIADGAWRAGLDALTLDAKDSLQPGTWTLQVGSGVTLDWKGNAPAQHLEVSAGTASLSGPAPGVARLNWQPARWTRRDAGPAQWRSQGELKDLPLAWLELLAGTTVSNLGGSGDMMLGGTWDLAAGDTLRLRAQLERTSGNLRLQADDDGSGLMSAGVREARIILSADGPDLSASVRWDSERAGQVTGSFKSRLQRQDDGWAWPEDTPVTGSVRARMPRLGVWSALAPPGWRLRGTLDANATLGGTRGAPQWRGTLQADELAVRSVVDGIEFRQGRLRASLEGQRLDIQEFSLQGASGAAGSGGLLTVKGFVLWPPADGTPASGLMRLRMELTAQAQGLRVSARADRRLAVSGQLSARLADAQLAVRGSLKADQALFVLPEDSTPALGADVMVLESSAKRTRTTADPTPSSPPGEPAAPGVRVAQDIAITLDLGPDFRLRGRGLVTRLAGNLTLTSTSPGAPQPRLNGEIKTVSGTYRAYGQQLDIEEGVLRFAGPVDNPFLDVRAIRPNLTQRVGVQITGTALLPRVRLFSEPELPDVEALSWLILGHSGANGGAESALLQQAALALLGGSGGLSGGLAAAVGLDQFSVRGSTTGADGTASGATVTLGKRFSRDFYVAYERSLAGTLGTFYIFYDLSSRFTLRAQSGEQSAVDLIFTIRYD